MTLRAVSGAYFLGAPTRGASSSPLTRPAINRWRHFDTRAGLVRSSPAMVCTVNPSAEQRMMCARSPRRRSTLRWCTHELRMRVSSSVSWITGWARVTEGVSPVSIGGSRRFQTPTEPLPRCSVRAVAYLAGGFEVQFLILGGLRLTFVQELGTSRRATRRHLDLRAIRWRLGNRVVLGS
jgi:hypothetical protein